MRKKLKREFRVKRETLRQLTPAKDEDIKQAQGGVLCSKCATTCLGCRNGSYP